MENLIEYIFNVGPKVSTRPCENKGAYDVFLYLLQDKNFYVSNLVTSHLYVVSSLILMEHKFFKCFYHKLAKLLKA